MYLATTSLYGLAMAGLSFAQTSTITLYIPGADTQPLVASIVGSDATATTYAVQCAPGTDSSDCGFAQGITLTEGPAIAKYTMPADKDAKGNLLFTASVECSLAGTTSAVCIESFDGSDANFPGVTTETYSGTDQPYMPVVITAGAAGSPGSSPNSAVPTTTKSGSAAASSSGLSTKASVSGGSSSAVAQTTGSQAAKSTAGVAAITGNKRLVFGGAAMALAMMA